MPRLKREEVAKRQMLIISYFKAGKDVKQALEQIKIDTGMTMAPDTVQKLWQQYKTETEIGPFAQASVETTEAKPPVVSNTLNAWMDIIKPKKSRLEASQCFKGSLYKIVDGGKTGVFVENRDNYSVFEAEGGMEFAVDNDELVVFIA